MQENLFLFAANSTKISTYGTIRLTLDLNLRRSFSWSIVVADVHQPIIGVDFLKTYNLLVDVKNNCLIDAETKLHSSGILLVPTPHQTNISILLGNSKFDNVLAKYPELTNPSQRANTLKTSPIYHHIETTSPPVLPCYTPQIYLRQRSLHWFGFFEFLATPFGLRNAGQTFQRYIHQVLLGLDFCVPNFDDLLIASSSEEEHIGHLQEVFDRLKEHGLKLNPAKCVLGKSIVSFLGCLITPPGVKPLPKKTEAIVNFPKPRTVAELRRFLAITNFYRHFIEKAAATQAPLNEFLRDSKKNDKRPASWTDEISAAFEKCNSDLANCATLSFYSPGQKLSNGWCFWYRYWSSFTCRQWQWPPTPWIFLTETNFTWTKIQYIW